MNSNASDQKGSFLLKLITNPNRISWMILSINLNNVVNLPLFFILNLLDSIMILYILAWRLIFLNSPETIKKNLIEVNLKKGLSDINLLLIQSVILGYFIIQIILSAISIRQTKYIKSI